MPYWSASRVELLADPRHQRLALVANHIDEGDLAQHAAQRRVQQRRELDVGGLDRADALVEAQRVLDAIAGESVDHQPLLVRGDDFLRRIFQIENALVDRDHGVDERRLEVQAGFGDDAHGLAEPDHQHLFGLRDREDRAVADDDDDKQQDQGDNACNGGPHRVPPCCWLAGGRRRRTPRRQFAERQIRHDALPCASCRRHRPASRNRRESAPSSPDKFAAASRRAPSCIRHRPS